MGWNFYAHWGEEWGMSDKFYWYPTFYWEPEHKCIHWMWGCIGIEK